MEWMDRLDTQGSAFQIAMTKLKVLQTLVQERYQIGGEIGKYSLYHYFQGSDWSNEERLLGLQCLCNALASLSQKARIIHLYYHHLTIWRINKVKQQAPFLKGELNITSGSFLRKHLHLTTLYAVDVKQIIERFFMNEDDIYLRIYEPSVTINEYKKSTPSYYLQSFPLAQIVCFMSIKPFDIELIGKPEIVKNLVDIMDKEIHTANFGVFINE
ncbi:MAG: hypothetical protein HY746_07195 [Elusimicrobia bacterium]|nr:hypothetical protein [Elusimicrobiota bacterium]